MTPEKHVHTQVLDTAYFETGLTSGLPTVLLHGCPHDVHRYVEVAQLSSRGRAAPRGARSSI
jgi:hypothetical protein